MRIFLAISFGIILSGCAPILPLTSIGGNAEPQGLPAYTVCSGGLDDGNISSFLNSAYGIQVDNASQAADISYFYSDGLYICGYQFARDYISSDTNMTYFHHSVQAVVLSTPDSTAASPVTIVSPLKTISDTIINQMPTQAYNQQQQDINQKAHQVIQDQMNYINEHPCTLWQTQGGVTTCIQRQGEF